MSAEAATPPDRGDPRIQSELFRRALVADRRAVLATLLVAPFTMIALSDRGVPGTTCLAWLLVVSGPALARAWLARGGAPAAPARGTWLALVAATALALGAAALPAAARDPAAAALVAALTIAITAVVTLLLAASRPAIYLASLPALLPPIWSLARADGLRGTVEALFGALMLWLILELALRNNTDLADGEALRLRNEDLMPRLQSAAAAARQAVQDKTRFLAAAAHDLRQPLHALGLFCAALDQRLQEGPEKPLVRSMLRSIEALESSFGAMLDISRLDAGIVTATPQAFPVRDLFRRLHLQFAGDAEARGLGFRFRAARRVVVSDPQLLERVLANLVQNALRYTRAGGLLVAARRHGADVSLEVWDTGLGIAADKLEPIFEEFYQVENPERDRGRGLGMGLAIVRRLCQLLGHRLEVASRLGRGSVFRVIVPSAPAPAVAGPALEAETRPPRIAVQATVILIDDERAIRDATVELLRPLQIEVLAAGSIAEAEALASGHRGRIDLILSDWRLRGTENGIDAVRAMRRIVGDATPAVLVTGDTAPETLKAAHEQGLTIMHKPLSPRELLKLIERLAR